MWGWSGWGARKVPPGGERRVISPGLCLCCGPAGRSAGCHPLPTLSVSCFSCRPSSTQTPTRRSSCLSGCQVRVGFRSSFLALAGCLLLCRSLLQLSLKAALAMSSKLQLPSWPTRNKSEATEGPAERPLAVGRESFSTRGQPLARGGPDWTSRRGSPRPRSSFPGQCG